MEGGLFLSGLFFSFASLNLQHADLSKCLQWASCLDLVWIQFSACLQAQSWVASFTSRFILLMTKLPHLFFFCEKYVQMENVEIRVDY